VNESDTFRQQQALRLKRLKSTQHGAADLVRISVEPWMLPAVLEPAVDGVDLKAWVASSRELLAERLRVCGALLFRGFEINGMEDFNSVVDAFSIERMHYTEGATPRTELRDFVYTSTEFPPEHAIALHNELSYVVEWPMRIWFYCQTPAEQGGETPIADVRRVLERIDPAIRRRFEQEGWMLVRNLVPHLSLSWQSVFRTEDPAEVTEYCRRSDVQSEWISPEQLRTRQVRPALARHPQTGESVWFNHIVFWHESSLPCEVRKLLKRDYGEHNLPFNTYYGSGAPIDDEVVALIRAAYDASTVVFPWRSGDLLLLDNMLAAHGRKPYSGVRRVLVAMGGPQTERGVSVPVGNGFTVAGS
jgi:hypothetical protein